MRFLCLLESYRQVDVELSSGQVVWYGILDIVDVGYPIIAADIRKVKQVENSAFVNAISYICNGLRTRQ